MLLYLDAGVYGTDEKDVGEYEEDTDVDPQHDWSAAGKTWRGHLNEFTINLVSLLGLIHLFCREA